MYALIPSYIISTRICFCSDCKAIPATVWLGVFKEEHCQ